MRGLTWVGTLIDRISWFFYDFMFMLEWFLEGLIYYLTELLYTIEDFFEVIEEKADEHNAALTAISEQITDYTDFTELKTVNMEDVVKGLLIELRLIRMHMEIMNDEKIEEIETRERL